MSNQHSSPPLPQQNLLDRNNSALTEEWSEQFNNLKRQIDMDRIRYYNCNQKEEAITGVKPASCNEPIPEDNYNFQVSRSAEH